MTIDDGDDSAGADQQRATSALTLVESNDRPRSWWTALLGRQHSQRDVTGGKEIKPFIGTKRSGDCTSPPRGARNLDDPQSPLKRSNSARGSPAAPAWPVRFSTPRWKSNATHPVPTTPPTIFVDSTSRASSVTDFGSEGRASLDGSPPSGVLSHAALHAFRNEEIQSMSGATLFGDSEGELHGSIRSQNASSSTDSLPAARPHAPAHPLAIKPPSIPKLVFANTDTKKPALPKSSAEAEDRERNARHLEVVGLQNGTTRLPAEFREQFEIGELLGDGAFGFVMTARSIASRKEVSTLRRADRPRRF